jgi:Ca-activated chloride channel family protein
MGNNITTRRHRTTPRYYSLALSIPGLLRPVSCIVTAFNRSDARRQAQNVLRRIKVKVVAPGTLAMLGLLAVAVPRDASAQGRVFKSGVDMVALTVTVTDAKGRCVTGLTADSFTVLENGVQQAVSLFGSAEIPVDVALVLDTSGSMGNAMPVVKNAARAVVDRLRPGDRAAIIDVKERTRIPQPFTEDRESVVAAVNAVSGSGATALYDGVYTSLREFERMRRQQRELRRHALVVLSDGVDTSSHVTFDDVTTLARTLDVTIYTIALRDANEAVRKRREMLSEPVRRATWEMRTLATETGGLVFFPTVAAELGGIYDTIARELTNQYALAYVSSVPHPDGAFRRVALKLLPPAQGVARTRSGYVAANRAASSGAGPF